MLMSVSICMDAVGANVSICMDAVGGNDSIYLHGCCRW